jgi:P-type Cu2+ transporter
MDTLNVALPAAPAPPTQEDAAFVDPGAYARLGGDGLSHLDLSVRGARCAGCLRKIEGGLSALPGVEAARLNLTTGKLSIAWRTESLAPADLARTIARLGYHAVPYDAGTDAERQSKEERFLLRCLAVAGFASANVMLMSISVWAGEGEMDAVTRGLFIWISAAVALPAVAYAGRPFFRSAFAALKTGHANMDVPISLAVLLATGLSLFETVKGGGDTYFEAAVMLLFLLLIGRFLDSRLRGRTRGAAQRLAQLQVASASRIETSGAIVAVPARDIVPGDRVLVGCGDRIPVNGIIEDGRSTLDASLLTGETTPADVGPGAAVYSGAINLLQPLTLRATAAREDSLLADIAHMVEAGEQARSRYVRLADKAASLYVPSVHSLAFLTFVGWLLIGGIGVHGALVHAIAVLIITCPCALGLAVPAVQVVATGQLFDRGILVKSGDALERLARADLAVFDKTGTLTMPQLSLAACEGVTAADMTLAASLARASRHPLAAALARAAGPGPVAADLHEEPGMGLEASLDGRMVRLGNRAWCGVPAADLPDAPELWLAESGTAPFRFTFEDRLKSDAAETVAGLAARGLPALLLSGDRVVPVAHAAAAAGIGAWHAGLSPREKVARLEALAAEGRRVVMIGDGLNDAPALAAAHVSISPASAIDASQAASDLILQGMGLSPLLDAVDIARKAQRRAYENLALAALYNACAVPLAIAGLVTPLIAALAMSGSSLLVTLNALRMASSRPLSVKDAAS